MGTALAAAALFLLARLGVSTPISETAIYLLLLGLGLGLGMVMQVLVLAAQNAVDYRLLGVATSGSALARQIGGSIGVSVFGAIFTNRLGDELARRLPPACTRPRTGALRSSSSSRLRSTRVRRGLQRRAPPGLPHRCDRHAHRVGPELAAARCARRERPPGAQ